MKNILICVSGLTPQIVTETLYCLSVQKKIKINELYIVTTAKGREIILGKDKDFNAGFKNNKQYPPLRLPLKRLSEKYKIKSPAFRENDEHIVVAKEQGLDINDIRNDKHNILFPNKICEVLKDKSSGNNTLHCSISGGRKTMSVDMAFALTLFGNINDKLYHVLVDEKVEFNKDFWFPQNKKEEKMIEISDLPFVKLRSLLGDFTKNKLFNDMRYSDLVSLMQEQLKIKTSDKLYIDWRKKEIWYGTNSRHRIEPKLISFYRELYKIKVEGNHSVYIKDMSKKFFNTYETKNTRSLINKLNKKITEAVNDEELSKIFFISNLKEFSSGKYGILADAEKIIFID